MSDQMYPTQEEAEQAAIDSWKTGANLPVRSEVYQHEDGHFLFVTFVYPRPPIIKLDYEPVWLMATLHRGTDNQPVLYRLRE